MKKTILILGNITFEETKAIVHEIHGIIDFEHAHVKDASDAANRTGEDLVNIFGAYLVPKDYKGEIVYECAKGIQLEKDEKDLLAERIDRAGEYLSNDYDEIEGILKQLDAISFEDGLDMRLEDSCEDIIVWEKVEGDFTVNEFLELIG